MIPGLTWGNLRWMAIFTLLLAAIATAPGPYQLNYSLFVNIWDKLYAGYTGIQGKSTEAARQLDAETKRRYGVDPVEPRAKNCVTTPTGTRITLQSLSQLRLSPPTNKASFIQILGVPYCQTSSGTDIWLVDTTQILEAKYQPKLTYQLNR